MVKFVTDGAGWYHTDTDIFRYTIKRVGNKQWFIYETPIGKTFGTHIASASRVSDAKAWIRSRVEKETLVSRY